jgi:hypothetical protein
VGPPKRKGFGGSIFKDADDFFYFKKEQIDDQDNREEQ